jgi:hypothetical protein
MQVILASGPLFEEFEKNKKKPWFMEVARTKRDPKKNSTCRLTFSQIWLIPLVDDCQSTYLTQLKKTKTKKTLELRIF